MKKKIRSIGKKATAFLSIFLLLLTATQSCLLRTTPHTEYYLTCRHRQVTCSPLFTLALAPCPLPVVTSLRRKRPIHILGLIS